MAATQRRDDLEGRFSVEKGLDFQPRPLMEIEQKDLAFLIRSGRDNQM